MKKQANQLNMQKNYGIDNFDYEGLGLWHTQYSSFNKTKKLKKNMSLTLVL